MYGLKQAPRAQFERLYVALLQFGFVSSKFNQSLFLRFTPKHTTFILVYIDDILITGSDMIEVQMLITKLNNSFTLKDLGEVDYFLGIQVKHTVDELHLSQTKCWFRKPGFSKKIMRKRGIDRIAK